MDTRNITPESLAEELQKSIIGQEEYVKDLSTALWMHYLRYNHYIQTGNHLKTPKTNILVIGKSGSGKTLAAELLAKEILNLPLVIENASLLTGSGWRGNSVDSLALRAVSAANGDEELEKYAVIVLDECDKLFGSNRVKDTGFSPVANLLTFIGGSKFTFEKGNDKITVDTSNMLFIFLGTFDGLEEIIQERISGKAGIGFGAACCTKQLPEKNIFRYTQNTDLHNYGIPWELLGRIQTITAMNELTAEDYREILLKSESSIIKQYDSLFRQTLGVHIRITDAAARHVARKAKDNEMGARGLNQIVAEVLQPVIYKLGSDDSISALSLDICDDDLFVKQIRAKRILGYEQLTLDERYLLEFVPFSCIRGRSDIWQYAGKIKKAYQKSGKMPPYVVFAATHILAAAIALLLMEKEPSISMFKLFQTLDIMSPDGIPDRVYPLAGMHNDFLRKAHNYGVDYHQARKTAENMLLDYCQNYLMERADEPIAMDAE